MPPWGVWLRCTAALFLFILFTDFWWHLAFADVFLQGCFRGLVFDFPGDHFPDLDRCVIVYLFALYIQGELVTCLTFLAGIQSLREVFLLLCACANVSGAAVLCGFIDSRLHCMVYLYLFCTQPGVVYILKVCFRVAPPCRLTFA